jgi:Mrp family chromosome partitioning ATPase/capsular polysaccharide biosynthesis protein
VEIGDYLRVIRRRLWILILVPVIAAAMVAVMVAVQPPKYRAVATVAGQALVGGSTGSQYSGPAGIRVFVANFTAALTAPQVLGKVSEQTGVSQRQIKENLTAEPIKDSSLIEVTYVARNEALATSVAKSTTSETIKFLFQTQVELAKKAVDEAEKDVAKADKALATFTKETGFVNPVRTYELWEGQITSLRERQLQAEASGDTAGAASLAAAVEALRDDLKKLAPLVPKYQNLDEQKTQAEARRADLLRNLDGLLAQSRAADPRLVVTVNEPVQLSRLSALAKQGGMAFAAGMFLAIVVVFLLELVRRPELAPRLQYSIVGRLPWSEAVESMSSHVLADQELAQAGEALLANLMARLGGSVRGVVVVTSPPGSHGKTVVSTLLATLLSRTNNHVLLVGTHLDYPAVSHSGDGNGHGMVPSRWAFSETAPLSWVTSLWALESQLWALPAWHDEKGTQLAPIRLSQILNEARDLFEVIIVDTPSDLDRHDLDIITWNSDGVLEVMANRNGAASMGKSAQAHVQDIAAPFVGLVINQVKRRPALVASSPQEPTDD